MNTLTALQKGFQKCFATKKMWLILYLFNLLAALAATAPMAQVMDRQWSGSRAAEALLSGFDYTVFMEFFIDHRSAVWQFVESAGWWFLLFFTIRIFLSGGIVRSLIEAEKPFSFRRFWASSGHFFNPMMRLTLWFLVFHAILFVIFGVIFFVAIKGGSNAKLESEVTIITAAKIIFPIYFLCALLLSMVQDYAKIALVVGEIRPLAGIRRAFGLVWRHFGTFAPFYALVMGLSGGIFWFWGIFQNEFSEQTAGGVLCFFLVSQLVLA
ncbi:MAG: hypothetical protein D6714_19800, partial [Bacteroidetes bacterium]